MLSVVFTDIVGSSSLWQLYPVLMKRNLGKHSRQVRRLVDKYNGLVLEFIGDAFLIIFKGVNNVDAAIGFAMNLQQELEYSKRIHFESDIFLRVRVGICTGDVNVRRYKLQNCFMQGVFGNVVNSASRFESKVCPAGGFVWGYPLNSNLNPKYEQKVIQFLQTNHIKYSKRMYTHHCLDHHYHDSTSFNCQESGSLLTLKCDDIDKLKGIKPVNTIIATLESDIGV